MNGVLRSPDGWADLLGAIIIIPDGWIDEGKDVNEPIDREEFDRLVAKSTIDSSGYPSFAGDVVVKFDI